MFVDSLALDLISVAGGADMSVDDYADAHFFWRASKVWHGGMKAARAKRKKDVARRCHYHLVRLLHCSFSALIGNQRGANVT